MLIILTLTMSTLFSLFIFFFFNDTATTEIYTLSLHDALPIHAEAECIAAPLFGIVSVIATRFVDRFKNSRMHHAAAGHFDPLLAAFQSFRSDVNLQTWLGKREEMRSKLHFGVGAKEFPHEKFELAFQIGDADVFIDIQSFDLMKLWAVRCIEFVAPIRRA